eukprot:3723707-Rhodomonas_salina.1
MSSCCNRHTAMSEATSVWWSEAKSVRGIQESGAGYGWVSSSELSSKRKRGQCRTIEQHALDTQARPAQMSARSNSIGSKWAVGARGSRPGSRR